MGKPAFKYVAYGECKKCGKPIVRNAECTVAVCTCESAVEVTLKRALLFRTNTRLYRKIKKIAEKLNVSMENLVGKTFEIALADKEFIDDCVKQMHGGRKKRPNV